MSIRRSTLIGTAVAMALFGRNGGAQAQQATTPAANEGSALEEVVVTGIRASLRESLETKRNATAFVDAITAEDVGKFPDKNLAESLQRVPGIVINREFGEGERVNLRGTASNLTRTLFNGHSLATADWFILDQLSTTRSFNYLMLPSDIIGKVAVYKSPQADLEEGGIGGLIDVTSRNPLDLKPNAIYGSFQMARADRSDKTDPNASALYSWKNDAETVGLLVAGTYQKRHLRRDGVEVLGYFDADPSAALLQAPALIGSALFTQERIRKGGNVTLQFRPSDKVDVNLSGLYSKFDGENLNENFMAWGTRAIGNGGTLSNATIQGDTVVAGRISSKNNGTADFGMVYDAIHRFATAETRSIDLDTKVQLTDDWGLHFKAGYTDAQGNTDAQPFVEFGAPAVFDYDLRGGTPSVHFLNVDPTQPSQAQFIFSSLHQILNNDDEKYAYADAERTVELGPLHSVKFGAKYTDHNRELIFNATTYGGFHVPINTTAATAFAGGPTPGNFLSGVEGAGTLNNYWQVDTSKVDSILFANLAKGTGRVTYPQQNFSVQEKATAGYVMGNLKGDRWRGNVGARIVRTEQTSIGALINPQGGAVQNPFGNFDPIKAERTYTDVLPSLNVVFDLKQDLLLRFAVAKVMARPDYTDIAPRVNLNIGALSGAAGNPDLDPYRANQADLSLEYYPDANTSIAFAVYYKDIKSFITDRPITEVFPIQGATAPSTACTPAGPLLFNCPFTINQRSNGGGGKIKGVELAVTKPIYAGFGVQANYTYSDATADNGDQLPQSSKNQVNLSGYFENPRVSTRLSYTYRSKFFMSFDRVTPLNEKALESVDASVVVNITENIAATVDAINITNEKVEQFAGEEFRPRAIYDNGRVYFAGVRFKF